VESLAQGATFAEAALEQAAKALPLDGSVCDEEGLREALAFAEKAAKMAEIVRLADRVVRAIGGTSGTTRCAEAAEAVLMLWHLLAESVQRIARDHPRALRRAGFGGIGPLPPGRAPEGFGGGSLERSISEALDRLEARWKAPEPPRLRAWTDGDRAAVHRIWLEEERARHERERVARIIGWYQAIEAVLSAGRVRRGTPVTLPPRTGAPPPRPPPRPAPRGPLPRKTGGPARER
jgi:hypothetical protein